MTRKIRIYNPQAASFIEEDGTETKMSDLFKVFSDGYYEVEIKLDDKSNEN